MNVEDAQVVLSCDALDETLAFFTDRLGFRLESILPADDPSEAVLRGHGLSLLLCCGSEGSPGHLRLRCHDRSEPETLVAPNGTRVELVSAALELPPLEPRFELSRIAEACWTTGRAGMRYRDLIPSRQGGRFIASHIVIPDAGPVPDYVHYHRVRVQMLVCYRGWVRVVYEDQGPPFVIEPGDCILQAPTIRHQVLESSDAFEIIEFSSPAIHPTHADHELTLPNNTLAPNRDFGGQRFVHHQAKHARWTPHALAGFEARDLEVAAATGGLASAQVLRPTSAELEAVSLAHEAEVRFMFVLEGRAQLARAEGPLALEAGDAFVIPPDHALELRPLDAALELLEICVG